MRTARATLGSMTVFTASMKEGRGRKKKGERERRVGDGMEGRKGIKRRKKGNEEKGMQKFAPLN